jgi:hypothetical protein
MSSTFWCMRFSTNKMSYFFFFHVILLFKVFTFYFIPFKSFNCCKILPLGLKTASGSFNPWLILHKSVWKTAERKNGLVKLRHCIIETFYFKRVLLSWENKIAVACNQVSTAVLKNSQNIYPTLLENVPPVLAAWHVLILVEWAASR